jgi:hypothetical protein
VRGGQRRQARLEGAGMVRYRVRETERKNREKASQWHFPRYSLSICCITDFSNIAALTCVNYSFPVMVVDLHHHWIYKVLRIVKIDFLTWGRRFRTAWRRGRAEG